MWFPLDEPTGATTFADVVSGDPGTCTGSACPTMVAGHVSSAQHFDGVAHCITVADAGQANPVALTISIFRRWTPGA